MRQGRSLIALLLDPRCTIDSQVFLSTIAEYTQSLNRHLK
jgi:hypothetical protein